MYCYTTSKMFRSFCSLSTRDFLNKELKRIHAENFGLTIWPKKRSWNATTKCFSEKELHILQPSISKHKGVQKIPCQHTHTFNFKIHNPGRSRMWRHFLSVQNVINNLNFFYRLRARFPSAEYLPFSLLLVVILSGD